MVVSSESVRLLVGFTAGQIQLIDPIKKELGKLYNEEVGTADNFLVWNQMFYFLYWNFLYLASKFYAGSKVCTKSEHKNLPKKFKIKFLKGPQQPLKWIHMSSWQFLI